MSESYAVKPNIGASFNSAALNVLLQVCSRILTFCVNAVILRYIGKNILGIVNVRLLLLYSTISFISHEPFRKAGLRAGNFKKPEFINVLWLSVPWTNIIGLVFGLMWLYGLESPGDAILYQYNFTVWCIISSCFIESLCEPLLIFCQASHFIKVKILAESFLVLTRTLLFGLFVCFYNQFAVLGFGIAQLISSTVFSSVYWIFVLKQTDAKILNWTMLIPKSFSVKNFDFDSLTLTWSFIQQSILKQILTEGERYIMSIFQVLTFSQQGIYDVVSNLGSLAARFILAPIEEASYLYFSQSLRSSDKRHHEEIKLFTSTLLSVLLYFGCIVCAYSLPYSKLLLHLYGGNILTDGEGPTLLKGQSFYVVFLAFNGILEAFVFAAMSQQEVKRSDFKSLSRFYFPCSYNNKMVGLSISLLLFSLALSHLLGSLGFIIANIINMTLRILHSLYFICKKYENEANPLNRIHLKAVIIIYLAFSSVLLMYLEELLYVDSKIIFLFAGGISFLLTVMLLSIKERQLFCTLNSLRQKSKFE